MPKSLAAVMREPYDEHAVALLAFCLHLTGNVRGRTEDLRRETLLRAWRNAAVLEESWGLVGSCNRVKLSRAEDRTEELLLSRGVAEAMAQLPQEHRAVLLECYYRGQSVAEAARRLGTPEGTAKSRTHYALRALPRSSEELRVGQ